jgi:uncharacterized protein (TIGR00269 family)
VKCKKCGGKAVINMRQHKLGLCKDHFLEWIPQQTQRFIEKYQMFGWDERVLVAVSGGKDSLSLWDVLHRLGYHADGLYINLGIDDGTNYSAQSQRLTEDFAEAHNLQLHSISIEALEGYSVPEASRLSLRGIGKPCSVCGLTKRHIMNRVAREHRYDVIVTGHNLDDEAAVLFGNTINWATGYLVRQNPVLSEKSGLVRKAKPFFRFYERETAAYALLRGIEYIYDECPYAAGAKSIYYKEVLNSMEAKQPGTKLAFFLSFLRAKESGFLANDHANDRGELQNCQSCGQPTTAPDICAYCRTWEQIRNRQSKTVDERQI